MRWWILLMLALLLPIRAAAAEAVEVPQATEGEIDAIYEEQLHLSGADRLADAVPQSAQSFVERFDLADLDPDKLLALRFDTLLRFWLDDLAQRLQQPFWLLARILGIVLLCSLLDTVGAEKGTGSMQSVFRLVAVLFLCAVMLSPLLDCMTRSAALLQTAAQFMLTYIPVFSAVLLLGGHALSASAYHVALFGVVEGVAALASSVLVPFLFGYLALCLTGSFSDTWQLQRVAALVKKTIIWLIGIAMTLLMGFLTLQSLVADSADTVSVKATRFVLSNAVPVVGSALSEALLTVKGCVGLLKNGVGGFGIWIGAASFVPMLAELAVWSLTLRVGVMLAELFGQKSVSDLLESSSSVVGILIALQAAFLLLMTLSTTILLLVGGSGG